MAKIKDRYPETLRDIHDKVEEVLLEAAVPAEIAAAVAVQVTEWIRRTWGGRTLTRQWWQRVMTAPVDDQPQLITEAPPADPVKSVRGRDLRAYAWACLVPFRLPGTCRLATAITALVESEWGGGIYVPAAPEIDRELRDLAVWQKFAGLSSFDGIIQGHKVSQARIYEIYRRVQKDKDRIEQPGLPGLG